MGAQRGLVKMPRMSSEGSTKGKRGIRGLGHVPGDQVDAGPARRDDRPDVGIWTCAQFLEDTTRNKTCRASEMKQITAVFHHLPRAALSSEASRYPTSKGLSAPNPLLAIMYVPDGGPLILSRGHDFLRAFCGIRTYNKASAARAVDLVGKELNVMEI